MPEQSTASKHIIIIGCFDTKEEDFAFLYDRISRAGEKIITINVGVMESPVSFPVDIDADEVAEAAGESIEHLRIKRDRGHAVKIMGDGAAKIIARLVEKQMVKGAIGLGGGGGTYITLSAMQSIPIGIPKVCVSTLAGKDVSRQLGNKDVVLMPSIVDVAGLNSIIQPILNKAAAAICAMANVDETNELRYLGKIAISMFGNTSVCVDKCTELLRKQGYEVFAFHANGVGGKAMEGLIREGLFDAVIDVTTTELADELCGGICSAGPERLTAAGKAGIPQVVVPGCLDMVNFAHPDTVPERFKKRQLYSWAPDVTLLRTNKEENQILGEQLAGKLNASSGPVAVFLPMKGISQIDSEGGVFHHPDYDATLFDAIKKNINPSISVHEVDANINDDKFSTLLVNKMLQLLKSPSLY